MKTIGFSSKTECDPVESKTIRSLAETVFCTNKKGLAETLTEMFMTGDPPDGPAAGGHACVDTKKKTSAASRTKRARE